MTAALGAFVTHCDIRIEGAETGPLAGLTFAAKDLYDVAGTPTGCGNPDWIATHAPAEKTAPVIETLVAAGATLVGKTLTDELAYSLNGENHHFGTPVNVNAPGRIPGGSSNGSAAAVAGALVDFALGSDTGGSVRIPASFCGIYGLRPTHDRIPALGIQALAPGFDSIGWFARDPELMARVGRVIFDWRARAAPTRVLLPESLWNLAPAATREALQVPLQRLIGLVDTCEEMDFAAPDMACRYEAFRTLQGRQVWRTHGDWLSAAPRDIGPGIKERLQWTSTLTEADETAAAAVRAEVRAELDALLMPDTVIAAPVAPGPAPLCNLPEDAIEDTRRRILALTCSAGLGGLPQLSLPLARVEDCPVALSLMAGRGGDEMLLDLACRLVESD